MRLILVGLYDLIYALRKVNINGDLREQVRMFFGLCFDDLRKNLNFKIDALIYCGNNLKNDFIFDAPQTAKNPEENMNFFDSQTQSVSRKLAKHKQLLLERDTLIMLITDYMDLLDFYARNRYNKHLTLEEKKKLYKEVVSKKNDLQDVMQSICKRSTKRIAPDRFLGLLLGALFLCIYC